ncbi:hypothetical protein BZG00_15620 [Salinivibrio kushneri]|uniref:Uncharacterized protein n=1 Tax=Salinivibrio kushneri TaxID=1908198 RepID=A0AB36JT81_9GAMM|nr:hypothetical protein [Salinivibrio kushneri]OOE37404.1 hypothetical protein BZG00_15620 [Salinivibrio kushneri]QCP03510.1 hypothetical protein FCN78_13810 [Salinivibrio kushneri]
MSKLSETYIHLDINLDEIGKSRLKEYLSNKAPLYAEGIYSQDLEFAVFVEDGSLKVWLATAGIIYAGVAGYGSFRSGIDYLVKDARAISEKVFEDVKQSGVPQDRVINFQRRLGVPGQIKRVLAETRKLERESSNLTEEERSVRLASIRRTMERISKNLDHQEDADLLRSNLPDLLRDSIPKRLPQRDIERARLIALKPEEYESLVNLPVSYPALSTDRQYLQNPLESTTFEVKETPYGIRFLPKY